MILSQLIITFRICLLRAGPQDLVHSRWLLALLIIAWIALSIQVHALLSDREFGQAEWISMGYMLVIRYALLSLFGVPERFVQTMTALLASGMVLRVLILPLSLLLDQAVANDTNANSLVVLSFLGLAFWTFIVDAHIYQQALNRSFHIGMLITIAIFMGDLLLLQAFSEGTAS